MTFYILYIKIKIKQVHGPNKSNKLYAHSQALSTVNHCRMHLGWWLSHLKIICLTTRLHSRNIAKIQPVILYPKHPLISFSTALTRYPPQRHTMLSVISISIFPGINYSTVITLMPDYLCNILLQGSEDLSLEGNKKSLWNLDVSIKCNC